MGRIRLFKAASDLSTAEWLLQKLLSAVGAAGVSATLTMAAGVISGLHWLIVLLLVIGAAVLVFMVITEVTDRLEQRRLKRGRSARSKIDYPQITVDQSDPTLRTFNFKVCNVGSTAIESGWAGMHHAFDEIGDAESPDLVRAAVEQLIDRARREPWQSGLTLESGEATKFPLGDISAIEWDGVVAGARRATFVQCYSYRDDATPKGYIEVATRVSMYERDSRSGQLSCATHEDRTTRYKVLKR